MSDNILRLCSAKVAKNLRLIYAKNTIKIIISPNHSEMSITKIEFAVQMTCESCVNSVEKVLKSTPGIQQFNIDLQKESVVVESNLPTLELQKVLESTGKKVRVKGYDGSLAAVSILEGGDRKIQGVVRFVQATPDICVIDGTIDGLKPGSYGLFVHECGDISQGCDSVGDIFNPDCSNNKRVYGDLGTINADKNGRAAFRLEDDVVKLSDIIGRSLVTAEKTNDRNEKLACGIIARSAGLFQNPKKICACDGTTLWDEVKTKSVL